LILRKEKEEGWDFICPARQVKIAIVSHLRILCTS
jgi:hypothetical protein